MWRLVGETVDPLPGGKWKIREALGWVLSTYLGTKISYCKFCVRAIWKVLKHDIVKQIL